MTSGGDLIPNADDSQSQSNRGPDQRQTPTSGPAGRDSIAGNRQSHINSGGGHVVGGHMSTDNSRKTAIHLGGAVLAIVIIVVVIIIVTAVVGFLGKVGDAVKANELNAQTTCADYLKHDSEERARAVREVGVEVGNRDAGNPLMFNEVDYECGSNPKVTLGRILRPN